MEVQSRTVPKRLSMSWTFSHFSLSVLERCSALIKKLLSFFQDWFAECCLGFSLDSPLSYLDQQDLCTSLRRFSIKCVPIKAGITYHWDYGLVSGLLPFFLFWLPLMLVHMCVTLQGKKNFFKYDVGGALSNLCFQFQFKVHWRIVCNAHIVHFHL